MLNEELLKANETIQFLSQITGSNPNIIQKNLGNVSSPSKITGKADDLIIPPQEKGGLCLISSNREERS